MNLTDSDVLKFLRGTPILLDDICAIYPATLGEIADIGYDVFQKYLGAITAKKPDKLIIKKEKELSSFLNQLTDFQYVLFLATMDADIQVTLKDSFRFFCHEEIMLSFDSEQIIIGPIEEQHILTEDKFYDLQHIIRCMYFLEEIDDESLRIAKDEDPRVRAIKEKIARDNKKREELRRKQTIAEGEIDIKTSDLIASLALNNCGLNIDNIWNITYYAFHDQLRRMGWRDQFNINHRAALAGAKIENGQLKHWIRSIHNGRND